jgi:hypothetical protein
MRLTLFGISLIGLICAQCRGDIPCQHQGARLLQSADGRLVVEVIDPANPPPQYLFRDRFTPSAFVTQAVLDGKPFLYASILDEPKPYLGGMPAEFDIGERTLPQGYTDADIGEPFMKIGIGRLLKDDVTYQFFKDYPDIEKTSVSAIWRDDGATFRQVLSESVRGYSYALESELKIEGSRLIHTTRLTNTGEKPFVTEQYLHNFLRFSDCDTGSDYVLRFPFDIAMGDEHNQKKQDIEPCFVQSGPRELTFTDSNPSGKPMLAKTYVFDPDTKGHFFTVEHLKAGQRLTIKASKPFFNVGVWITDFQISPEAHVLLDVAPGETETLVRTYEFENVTPNASK